EKAQQCDIFEKPQIESDESVAQAADAAVAESEEADKEKQRIYEAMKEEGYFSSSDKKSRVRTARKEWLALGRKLNGEDKQEKLL
ncbi:MAG: hypothetical protein AAB598_00790, partial [Patescibacteria group bacterium]